MVAVGSSSLAKVCVKCKRIVSLGTIVCPDCGSIMFADVELDN